MEIRVDSIEQDVAGLDTGLFETSIADKTMRGCILWGTDAYISRGDRVVVSQLWVTVSNRDDVAEPIRRDGRRVFVNGILPKVFDEAARKVYVENTEAFEDSGKYKAMMREIGNLQVTKFDGKQNSGSLPERIHL